MNIIFRTIHGSRLYGMEQPGSDVDFKAVHIPTAREIVLGKRKKIINKSTGSDSTRNTSKDVDREYIDVQEYLKLLAGMQTIAVEILFAPGDLKKSEWKHLEEIAPERILNKNANAFVGYCKSQATRFSRRSDKLNTFEAVCDVLRRGGRTMDHLDDLRKIPNVKIEMLEQPGGTKIPFINVYDRKCAATVRSAEALHIYEKPVKEAGSRAKAAQDAGGMDNKALYHAIRIADEGIELFSTGKITFPVKNRDFLMKIRAGEVPMDQILDTLDEKIVEMDALAKNSDFRDAPDLDYIDDWVECLYGAVVTRYYY